MEPRHEAPVIDLMEALQRSPNASPKAKSGSKPTHGKRTAGRRKAA